MKLRQTLLTYTASSLPGVSLLRRANLKEASVREKGLRRASGNRQGG